MTKVFMALKILLEIVPPSCNRLCLQKKSPQLIQQFYYWGKQEPEKKFLQMQSIRMGRDQRILLLPLIAVHFQRSFWRVNYSGIKPGLIQEPLKIKKV